MKRLTLLLVLIVTFSCKDHPKSADAFTETDTVKKEIPGTEIPKLVPNVPKAGVHPITLQWISWEKPGEATLIPDADGWYKISGSQLNESREYLNIEGKIKRISEKELEFEGTVETRTRINNGGEPCFKKGVQKFVASGERKFFRLQNMENCQGGNTLDYVDIYPGTSGL